MNGAFMKSLYKHQREVSAVCYAASSKTVVTASWDRSIAVIDEMPPDAGIPLRVLEDAHAADITAATVSEELALIASGDAAGIVHVWDFEYLRHECSCVGHLYAIKCLAFVTPFPALVTSGASRAVCLTRTRTSRHQQTPALPLHTHTHTHTHSLTHNPLCRGRVQIAAATCVSGVFAG